VLGETHPKGAQMDAEQIILSDFGGSGFIGLVCGVLGFMAKSLWDRYLRRTDEEESLRRNKKIEFIEKQLSDFYIPLYAHLQKDNAVWEKILGKYIKEENLERRVAIEIEKGFILPNHEEAVRIIESRYHLARADKTLTDELFAYVKHVAVYMAIRKSTFDVDPIVLDEPFPKKLFPLIEGKVLELQNEYNLLLTI
jgi:hypothetical protein